MALAGYGRIAVRLERGVLTVTLARPEKRNALDPTLVAELARCFGAVQAGRAVRAIVLAGSGAAFCAGADLDRMRAAGELPPEENEADALALADALAALDGCPVPTVARVHGAALGGGAGLVACCDVAVAAEDAVFGFGEVKLGIVPAVIAPYVVGTIGASQARALFTTGERFDAARALRIGLVHRVAPSERLDAEIEGVVAELQSSAPLAASAAKRLVRDVLGRAPSEVRELTARRIAELRASPEGREGLAAFLERRTPNWVAPEHDAAGSSGAGGATPDRESAP